MSLKKQVLSAFLLLTIITLTPLNPAYPQDFSGNSISDTATGKNSISILKKLFADAKPGDWVTSGTKKKYIVKTIVVEKTDTQMVLEIQNIVKDQLQSTATQTVDLINNYISEVIITDNDGKVTSIPTDNLLLNQINVSKYEKVAKDVKIKVPAGKFTCDKYKIIADDKVIYFWLSDQVPVNKIVKAKIKHSVVKLYDYAGR